MRRKACRVCRSRSIPGLFWPRRSFLRMPGTVIVEMLDPIAPGLDKDAFFERLRNEIETATARLIAEGREWHRGKPLLRARP